MLRLIFSFTLCFICVTGTFIGADEAQKRIIDRYKEILIKAPKRGTTFDRVYNHYADTGQTDVLYQEFLSATQKNPEEAKSQLLLGLIAERQNKHAEAAAAFQTAATLEPDNFLPMLYFGEVLLNQRKVHEAIVALEQAHKRLQNNKGSKNDLRTVLQTLALAYSRTGNPQKSLETWKQLAELFPDDPDILAQVAESLESEGKLDEAIEQYRRLINVTDEPAERVRLSLAIIDLLIKQGNSDPAKNESVLNELETLLGSLDSESYLADGVRNRIDKLFERSNDINRQIEFYRKRIAKAPNDTASLLRLIKTFQQNNQHAEVEKLLLDAIKSVPSNMSIRLTLIDHFTAQKEIGKAIVQFQAMDTIAPLETEQLVRWGTLVLQNPALLEAARKTEAIKIWNRVTTQSPNDPNVYILTADLFAKHQFLDEAERCYKQAAALRPDEFSYRASLATFYHKQNRKNDLLAVLQPDRQHHREESGQLLLAWGYLAEAEQILRQAVQVEPANATLQCRYLDVLLRLNHFTEVTKLLNEAETTITDNEQFALFLQNEVRLLQSAQKLTEARGIIQERLKQRRLESTSSPRTLWHLAALQQAEGTFAAAILGVSKALEQKPVPVPLLRFTAELYEQSGNTAEAITLYQQLIQDDPARSGNYWQQIITLHVQRGEMPLALETSQKLLGRGTENAERLLFVAELFLNANRRSEAVKLLRQALVLEPNNTDALRMLAQTLADSDQHEEAIELLWQLYDKLEHVPAKLSAIEMLANVYSTLGRDIELFERLEQLSRNNERRPEAMQAMVRVCIVQGADETAQEMLEDLLVLLAEKQDVEGSLTRWTLRELVDVAERLDDLPTAVHYQEMLCHIASDPVEQNHLFYLYDKLGDTTKTSQLFFDQVLMQSDWQGRFELIDTMIVRGQYDLVSQVLDFLAIHEPDHWGVAYRKILITAYQNKPVEFLVKQFRAMQVAESAMIVPTSAPKDYGYNPLYESTSFVFFGVAPEEWQTAWRLQDRFLSVLFYPELQKYDTFKGKPLDEFCSVQNYKDARFLVQGFLLREAIYKDLQTVKDNPEGNPHVWRQFRHTAEELRDKLPVDSSKVDVVLERVRLEFMLLDLISFDALHPMFPKGILDLQIDQRLCQRTIGQIIRKLALDGSVDWQPALYQILTLECINELVAERFKGELASNAKRSSKLVQILDTLHYEYQLPPMYAYDRNFMISQADTLVKASLTDHQENHKETSMTLSQKTDRLLALWKELIENARPETWQQYQYHFVSQPAILLWILRSQNREADANAFEESLRKTIQQHPLWLAENLSHFTQPINDDLILFQLLSDNESLEAQFTRIKNRVLDVLPYCTDKQTNIKFCNLLCQNLYERLSEERLDRYDIQATINADQMKRLAEFEQSLQQFAGFVFQVLGELKLTPSDFASTDPAPAESKVVLTRYLPELQGERPIDRGSIFVLLAKKTTTEQNSAVDDLFHRILQLRLELTEKTKGKVGGDYSVPLRQLLETKKHSTAESDRLWSQHLTQSLSDLLETETLVQEQPAEPNSQAELLQYVNRLKTVQKDRTLTSAESLALTLLYVRLQQFPDAVKTLDSMELTTPMDGLVREWIAASLAMKQVKTDTVLKQRGNEAASRLLNYRLSDRDQWELIPILKHFDRTEELQQLWDRLAESVTDRRLLGEMLQKAMTEGDSQKENTAKIAKRILLNPAFLQNVRRLTSEVNTLTSAVNVLREQNQWEPVLPIVENRLKGLRNQTDSRLLRARLYLMLDRQEEAKALALELSQNPTAEPERRQMIVSLLIQFNMQKELESMNRLLLEKR